MRDWEFEFETLMQRLLDGQLDARSSQRLDQLLTTNSEAMDWYVRLMALDTMLQSHARSPAVEMGQPAPAMSVNGQELSSATENHRNGARPDKTTVLGFLGGVVDYVNHSRMLMLSLICGALGVYFSIQFGSILLSRFTAQHAQVANLDGGKNTRRHEEGVANPPDVASESTVARLSNEVDSRWEPSRAGDGSNGGSHPESVALPIRTEFSAGQRLSLLAGLAEITFHSGARVILHGPAQFVVSNGLGGDLQFGKLTAKVPHGAAGFTISTPAGKVVDLGTEFGVKVNADRTMHVIVYVGEVMVKSAVGHSAGRSEQLTPVKAGEAVVVAAGQPVKPLVAREERFIRDFGALGDKAEAEAAYVEFMKKLKPVVWFRMEGRASDRVLRDETGGRDAELTWSGPGNPFVKAPIGKSLWLRGEVLKDFAIMPDYPKAPHDKLSVVAWAYADSRPVWATVAKNWGGDGLSAGQFAIELVQAGNNGNDLSASIGQNDGKIVMVREGAAHPFPLYEWQHVAMVADGTTLRLYRQGREVATAACTSIKYPARLKALGVGVRTNDAGNAPHNGSEGFWSGKLDEVAVFNDALSPADVKKLANAPPP